MNKIAADDLKKIRNRRTALLTPFFFLLAFLSATAQAQTAAAPKQLVVVKEYKHEFAYDLSDDGALLILDTYTRGYDPRTKTVERGRDRIIEFESGKEIDKFDWFGVRGGKFLPGSHLILLRDYVAKTKELDKKDVSIRDTATKETRKCLVTNIANGDFRGGDIYSLDAQRAIVAFEGNGSMSPEKLFLLTFRDCGLKQIGQIIPDDASNSLRSLTPFSSRNNRFFAFRVISSNEGEIAIWDIETNEVIKWLGSRFPYSDGAGYTPDGKYFFVNRSENGKTYCQLYETEKYELVVQKELPYRSGTVAFSPDGKYMAFSYNNVVKNRLFAYVEPTVELYDTTTWNKVAAGKYPRYPYVRDRTFPISGGITEFTPDSKYLITTPDYTRVWRIP